MCIQMYTLFTAFIQISLKYLWIMIWPKEKLLIGKHEWDL